MVELSIEAMIRPFVPTAQYCFDQATLYITSKHDVSIADVNHDLKAMMFNAVTVLMVSTKILAYLRVISLMVTAATIAAFYCLRRVIDETLKPIQPEKDALKELIALTPGAAAQPTNSWTAAFYHDNTIFIGKAPIWIFTRYPLKELFRMTVTRGG